MKSFWRLLASSSEPSHGLGKGSSSGSGGCAPWLREWTILSAIRHPERRRAKDFFFGKKILPSRSRRTQSARSERHGICDAVSFCLAGLTARRGNQREVARVWQNTLTPSSRIASSGKVLRLRLGQLMGKEILSGSPPLRITDCLDRI